MVACAPTVTPNLRPGNQIAFRQGCIAIGRCLLLWLVLVIIASVSLERIGAFRAEFDGNEDEAAHMMTGVLVRDYVLSGTSLPAVKYAERHYLAYPKSAFGVWPPLFHFIAGVWFLLFEPTRSSAIFLMAALLALSAMLIFTALREEIGDKMALMSSLLMVICPVVVVEFGVVIADALLVPLALVATFCFARFLETHALRYSLWFGVFSALAFLTKYNAFLLIFIPVVGIALTRQWRLWLNARLWASPAVILLLAGPWYIKQIGLSIYASDVGPSGFLSRTDASLQNLAKLVGFFGPLGSLLIVVGLWYSLAAAKRPSAHAASQAGLLFGVWAMHSILYPTVSLSRYMLPAVPALLFFLCAGLYAVAIRLRTVVQPRYTVGGLALTAFSFMLLARPHEKPARAWKDLTSRLRELAVTKVVLVSGEAASEGALIADMALDDRHRETRPEWTILRGSKMLAKSSWMGADYKLRFNTIGKILTSLDRWGVSVAAVETTAPLQPHERLLLDALESSGNWQEDASPMDGMRIFINTAPPHPPSGPIEIDMSYTLGRSIKLTAP
jgi:hypothetical protein